MSQRYRAYLLRHWILADGRERVEVQQIQTGDRTRHPSLADACAWLLGTEQAAGGATGASPTAPEGSPADDEQEGPPRRSQPGRRAAGCDGLATTEVAR
jgi:hypothetical protein